MKSAYLLDASVIIEILGGSDIVERLIESIIRGDVEAYTTRLGLTEALYVTCRLWGKEKASQRMQILMESNAIAIIEDDKVWEYAAACKCEIPVSLGDCFTLGASKKYGLTPLFLRPEKELLKNEEKIKEWLGREIEYLRYEQA